MFVTILNSEHDHVEQTNIKAISSIYEDFISTNSYVTSAQFSNKIDFTKKIIKENKIEVTNIQKVQILLLLTKHIYHTYLLLVTI